MQIDSSATRVFEGAALQYSVGDMADVLVALRNHPVIYGGLNYSQSNQDESVTFLHPFGSGYFVETKNFALQLTRLTFKTSGLDAARLLKRFLTEGESRSLKGCEITLIWGLRSGNRIDIEQGVFLAPYNEIAEIYGPHPFARREIPQAGNSTLTRERYLLRDSPECVTALVREFTWGPAIAPTSESSSEFSQLPTARLLASDRGGEFLPSEDNERIRNFLTIATEQHQLSGGQYVVVDQWLTDIDKNYQFSWNSDSRAGNEWWQVNELDGEAARLFLEMVKTWVEYTGNREQLDSAIRQLATLYSRVGRSGTNDRILDAATALEMMYRLDAPEITYKLRVRAAFFLGNGVEERQEIFDRVGKFYGARSAVIHGNTRRRRGDPVEALSSGLALARNTLLAILRLGHAPKWDRMVMSAGANLDP